jgi:hypothetical protein
LARPCRPVPVHRWQGVRRVLVQMRGASEHGELNRAQQGGTGQSADRHQWRDSAAPLAPSNTVSPRCHSTGRISESASQTDDSTRVIAPHTRSLQSPTLRGLGSGGIGPVCLMVEAETRRDAEVC